MKYRRVEPADFEKIVALQNENLVSRLSDAEKADGFLSTAFTAEQFQEMDRLMGMAVAVEDDKLVGYVCAAPASFHRTNPLWATMLERCAEISYRGQNFDSYRYCLGSPIGLQKEYRGSGLYAGLCGKILEILPKDYDFIVAFISNENVRNMKATIKMGFEVVNEFKFNEKDFSIVVLPLDGQTPIAKSGIPRLS